jgi:hypothetical protein
VISRRTLLGGSASTLCLGHWNGWAQETATSVKRVAAVVTIYRRNSHADVLVGKILEGWKQDGGPGPRLKLESLYVDQFPGDDLSRELAKKHGFRICKSIRECLELDRGSLAVDGVLSIGEHGDYPTNERGQHLYPRRRFFSEICDVFESSGRVVPVFNDKHPGPVWEDAKWMADRAKHLGVPWMAGSSLTVGERDPDVTLKMGSKLDACVAIGYSGLDIYGFHTLDFLQSIVERRATKNQGVASVQGLVMSELPSLLDRKVVDKSLLELGLRSSGTSLQNVMESAINQNPKHAAMFLVRYVDSLVVPVIMLASHATGISVACRTSDGHSFATRAEEKPEPRYPHFAYLLKAIETMFHTGRPAYPVERTLLASGILDRALVSLAQGNTVLESPELAIEYQPVDYPYAPHIGL